MAEPTTSPRKQATQNAILQAAYTLFSRKGFSNTTTREIAESAQVNELTLFRHFQNKTNILTQVIGTYVSTQKIDRIFAQLDSMAFEEGFHAFARMLLTELEEKYPMIRLMIIEATANPELKSAVGPIIVKLREKLVVHLRRGIAEGRVRQDLDLDLVAQSFLWIFMSYVINRSDVGQQFCPYPPEDVAQASTEIFLQGLRPTI